MQSGTGHKLGGKEAGNWVLKAKRGKNKAGPGVRREGNYSCSTCVRGTPGEKKTKYGMPHFGETSAAKPTTN